MIGGSPNFKGFQGSLDGQNHAIIGLNINSTIDKSYNNYAVGLFGELYCATVKNLFFIDANVFVSGDICTAGAFCSVGILAGNVIIL